jgi:putative membrane protein
MMHNRFGTGFDNYGDWLCGPGAFFPGPLGWIITLLFWALVIFLVVKLFQALFSKGKGFSTTRLDTLKERYARGEISEDEYLRMKTELG